MSKGYKHLSTDEFKQAKLLQQAGLSANLSAKTMKRSPSVMSAIYKADSFDEYKANARDSIQRSYVNRGLTPQGKMPEEASATVESMLEDGKSEDAVDTQTNDDSHNLARIASALERLADAWENTPKKRSLF